ncbi:bile salt-activated lipase-like [Schistocerca gregaria]|uniref:bile salt-activated lipase-like n=1 Tax=Schistocerca gregaria TaxID=7010 RepID=UPI00211DB831|nr:bile salt-activated lipase-like [Schistocerca gregaria]
MASHCPQRKSGLPSGDEDCLYLNVYGPGTPSQNATKKAVMVWIHGGCFTEGSGESAKPNYFVDNDVIVVSINYRLGLLGFLSTGDGVVPGNMGLKDQAEALRWVQRNIAAFGGDPDKVTIFGQSAGGASVHYHVLSSSSKGLFKNAIAMSGSALNPWAFSKNSTDRAIRYAKTLGYTGKSSNDLVDFLTTVDFGSLLSDETIALSDEDSKSLFTCVWVPSAEPEHESAFLTEEPWTLVAEGRFTYVPYMSGVTDLEQLAQVMSHGALSSDSRVRNLDENFDEIVGCDLRLPTRKERLDGALSVKQYYYNGSEITMTENYTTALFDSHLFFVEGVDAVIRSTARYSSEPVFYYEFSFNGPLSSFPGGMGAAHADDIHYLFATSTLDPDSDGGIVRAQMTAMWTNFAKYDNPTPEGNSLVTEVWNEYDESSPTYLEITSPLKTAKSLFGTDMNFWHDLLP